MKKACQYCGGIHDKKYICNKKTERGNKLDRFRWSYEWKMKRTEIMKRDRYLCRACLNNLSGTVGRICNVGLSVHHIIPLKASWEQRLESGNLITLCRFHHKMAEKGEISAEKLLKCIPPEDKI